MRDFKWDDEGLENQKKELVKLEQEEKELWVRVLMGPADSRPSCCASRG